MDYLIPEEMRIHYRMQIARLAHEVSAADVVVVAEPIAPPLVAPILRAVAMHSTGRPIVLQAEIGDPLWTRYLREVNNAPDVPGNPYVDVVGRLGRMPDNYKAEFRAWLKPRLDAAQRMASADPVSTLLLALVEAARPVSDRSARLLVLADQPYTVEDSDPYVLDELCFVASPAQPLQWQYLGIMPEGWLADIRRANRQRADAASMLWMVERASYDPRSLPMDERKLLPAALMELGKKLASSTPDRAKGPTS